MRFNANGIRTMHRSDFYLLSRGVLNSSELMLFEFFINQMGFDPEHEDNFGVIAIDSYSEIANFFGYSSENSVRTKVRKLVQIGLLIPIDSRRFRVAEHRRYLAQTDRWGGLNDEYRRSENNAKPSEVLQSIGVKTQLIEESSQIIAEKDDILLKSSAPRYLSSSKVRSNSSVSVPVTRPLAEYEEMKRSGEYPNSTISDLQWINSQTLEKPYP